MRVGSQTVSLSSVDPEHVTLSQTVRSNSSPLLPAHALSLSPDALTTSSWIGSNSAFINSGLRTSPTATTVSVSTLASALPDNYPAGPLSTSANSVASFADLPRPTMYQQYKAQAENPLASASLGSLAASSYIELPNSYDYKAKLEPNTTSPSFMPHQSLSSSALLLESGKPHSPLPNSLPNQSLSSSASLLEGGKPLLTASSVANPEPSMAASSLTMPLYVNPYLPQTSSFWARRQPQDNVSHISRLLAEIATLKKEKEELKDKLKTSEQKCEELRMGIGSPEDNTPDQDIGALIEEIRAAEKVRGQTSKVMVQVAQEDKEKAVKERNDLKNQGLKHLNQNLVHLLKSIPSSDLSDMEDDGIADSSASSSVSESGEGRSEGEPGSEAGSDLLRPHSRHELTQMIQRQRQIMSEELQKVIDQRNDARLMVAKLERKLAAAELKPKSDGKLQELIATLGVVRRERDVAVARLKTLMADTEEIKLVYSLHKALWREDPQNQANLSHFSQKLTNCDPSLARNNTVSSHPSKRNETEGKLGARLAFSDQEREVQSQRIDELEQLVKRQRQKLNALCAGPMLLDGAVETE